MTSLLCRPLRYHPLYAAYLCLGLLPFNASAADPLPSEKILAAIQPYVERQELAGAVALVANPQEVLSITSVGYANREQQAKMQPDTMFWIASQSKPITAAAVMLLVDDGRIQLDDPVEKYLPEFRQQMVVRAKSADRVELGKPATPFTIRQALAHTSGLVFKSLVEEPTLDLYPLSARVRSYAITPLDADPGTQYQYSNAGINTAARIVEVVSGQPFEVFLEERLLKPLGMTDTTFWPSAEQAQRLASAYQPGPENQGLAETTISFLHYPLTDRTIRTAMPGGGLFSTAADLAKFYQMLLNHGQKDGRQILSAAAVQELTRRQTTPEMATSYGLGFSVSPQSFGHGGAYSTNSTANTQQQLVLIWLVQHAGFPGNGKDAQGTFQREALAEYGKKDASAPKN